MILSHRRPYHTGQYLPQPPISAAKKFANWLPGFLAVVAALAILMFGPENISRLHGYKQAHAQTPNGIFLAGGSENIVAGPGQGIPWDWDLFDINGGTIFPEYQVIAPSPSYCGAQDGYHPWTAVAQPVNGRAMGSRTDITDASQIGCSYELRMSVQITPGVTALSKSVKASIIGTAPAPTTYASTDPMPFACYRVATQTKYSSTLYFVQLLQTGDKNIVSGIEKSMECQFGQHAGTTKTAAGVRTVPTLTRFSDRLREVLGIGSAELTTFSLVTRVNSLAAGTVILEENGWKVTVQTTGSSRKAAYFLATYNATENGVTTTVNLQLQTTDVLLTSGDSPLGPMIMAAMPEIRAWRRAGKSHQLDPRHEGIPLPPDVPAGVKLPVIADDSDDRS